MKSVFEVDICMCRLLIPVVNKCSASRAKEDSKISELGKGFHESLICIRIRRSVSLLEDVVIPVIYIPQWSIYKVIKL
jgi:hypothetical protein